MTRIVNALQCWMIGAMQNAQVMILRVEHEWRFDLETCEKTGVACNPARFTERRCQSLNRLINRLSTQAATRPQAHAIAAELLRHCGAIPKLGQPGFTRVFVRIECASCTELNRKYAKAVFVIQPPQCAHALPLR